MAMYYYASKLSVVACGLRCQQQRHRQQRHRRRKGSAPGGSGEGGGGGGSEDDDEEVLVIGRRKQDGEGRNLDEILQKKWNNQSLTNSLTNLKLEQRPHQLLPGDQESFGVAGNGGGAATSTIIEYHDNYKELPSNQDNLSAALPSSVAQIPVAVLGPNGVMYCEGRVVSGPIESLVKLLLPLSAVTNPPNRLSDELDDDFIFSFLLSIRIFRAPHELLGKLVADIVTLSENLSRNGNTGSTTVNIKSEGEAIDPESKTNGSEGIPQGSDQSFPALECLVKFLGVWTTKFPYDFRDERIMSHVKHIVAKCANNELNDIVSELLCALLARLTDLEQHEEDLRASLTPTNTEMGSVKWVSSTHLAQLLSRIERKLAKHVGAEEFVQCNANVLLKTVPLGTAGNSSSLSVGDCLSVPSAPIGVQGPKKTCNLETYLDWSLKLKLLVANNILQTEDLPERVKMVELWSGAAQYCLLVGNYNSATSILEALDSPAVARLTKTWCNLAPMGQQLSCMYRHAEGHGDLWTKQTTSAHGSISVDEAKRTPNSRSRKRSGEWVVIPVFKDIVRLALISREECAKKIGDDHLNVQAFDRMAAIVGAFTKHMNNVAVPQPTVDGEFELIFRQMNNCRLTSEGDLLASSCALEPDPHLQVNQQPNQNFINRLKDYS